jgi:hypothetical protein
LALSSEQVGAGTRNNVEVNEDLPCTQWYEDDVPMLTTSATFGDVLPKMASPRQSPEERLHLVDAANGLGNSMTVSGVDLHHTAT